MNRPRENLNLASTFVVLDPDLQAETVAVTDTIYAELDARFAGFKGHTLVSIHQFSQDWPTWEIHPKGDEVVCLISGDADLVLRTNGSNESVRLNCPGGFVVVPRNTWHTARVRASTTMLFITPGEATENRGSPPE